MGIKRYKPTTSTLRFTVLSDFSEITKSKPEKSLLRPLKKSGGRNVNGRITSRYRGGGHKRRYRIIDFKRNRIDEPAEIIGIEYDPNRTSRIALLQYQDGEKRYIICPLGLKVGEEVVSGENVEIKEKYRYYKLNSKTINPLMNLIEKHMANHCIHILRRNNE